MPNSTNLQRLIGWIQLSSTQRKRRHEVISVKSMNRSNHDAPAGPTLALMTYRSLVWILQSSSGSPTVETRLTSSLHIHCKRPDDDDDDERLNNGGVSNTILLHQHI